MGLARIQYILVYIYKTHMLYVLIFLTPSGATPGLSPRLSSGWLQAFYPCPSFVPTPTPTLSLPHSSLFLNKCDARISRWIIILVSTALGIFQSTLTLIFSGDWVSLVYRWVNWGHMITATIEALSTNSWREGFTEKRQLNVLSYQWTQNSQPQWFS